MADLFKKIKINIDDFNRTNVIKLMGYQNTEKGILKLESLLSAPDLFSWFEQSCYDFKYSSETFLLELCKILLIPEDEVKIIIAEIKTEIIRIEQMFQPSIFIDTQFKRKSEPVFILSILSGRRHINISKYDVLLNQEEEFDRIRQIIMEHYKFCSGKIEILGKIHQYIYKYADGKKVGIMPDGTISEPDEYTESRASLSINGRDLTLLPMFNQSNL